MPFLWSKPVYFDEAEVMLDAAVGAVDRLWIEKGGILSPAAIRSDGTSTALGKVYLDLYSARQGRWVAVWSAPILTDLLDFHGLSIKFNEQDVGGVRLRSMPPTYSTFLNFDNTVFNFGTNLGGSVELEAAQTVSVSSGKAVEVDSAAVRVDALDSVQIHAGGAAELSAAHLRVTSAAEVVTKATDVATFATGSVDSFAGERIGFTATTLGVDAFSGVEVG